MLNAVIPQSHDMFDRLEMKKALSIYQTKFRLQWWRRHLRQRCHTLVFQTFPWLLGCHRQAKLSHSVPDLYCMYSVVDYVSSSNMHSMCIGKQIANCTVCGGTTHTFLYGQNFSLTCTLFWYLFSLNLHTNVSFNFHILKWLNLAMIFDWYRANEAMHC